MDVRITLLVISALIHCGFSPPESLVCSRSARSPQKTTLPEDKEKGSTMRLSSYMLLDGNCKQAMEFYHSIFGGELTVTLVGESPMKAAFPVSLHSRVLNARLKSRLVDISASDWLRPNETPVKGNTLCLYLSGGAPGETTTLFRKLSEGADVTDPLSDQPYGLYGALNDKFGMRWMFHADKK
jgi:PhnB protein